MAKYISVGREFRDACASAEARSEWRTKVTDRLINRIGMDEAQVALVLDEIERVVGPPSPITLGEDYYLGCFIFDGRHRSIRAFPETSKALDATGVEALADCMKEAGAQKFMMVPVPELGDAIVALRAAADHLEHLRATLPPEE